MSLMLTILTFLQWPGAILGLIGACLVASQRWQTRRIGFACWIGSNVALILFFIDSSMWSLTAMQAVYFITSIRGFLNSWEAKKNIEVERLLRSLAAKDVLAERERQVSKEGWIAEHDDAHTDGELAAAASCYAEFASLSDRYRDPQMARISGFLFDDFPRNWPFGWDKSWWKPSTRRRDLIKSAALIIAEIERIDRLHEKEAKK